MKRVLFGTLTIGQAPRLDITPILERYLSGRAICIHAGVLDGLSRAEIERMYAVESDEDVLITRLLDGSSIVISKPKALKQVNLKIDSLRAKGCKYILLLCTGAFDGLICDGAWLIEPDLIVPASVAAIAGQRQVGIIVPLASQIASEGPKWRALARTPIAAVASPYPAENQELTSAARELRDQGAQLLVMDCMGFVEAHREAASRASGLPVILSNALIGCLSSELLMEAP